MVGGPGVSAMATDMTLWLSVTVLSSSCPKITSCSSNETFGNLLSRVQEEKFAGRRVDKLTTARIASSVSGLGTRLSHEVPLDAPPTATACGVQLPEYL